MKRSRSRSPPQNRRPLSPDYIPGEVSQSSRLDQRRNRSRSRSRSQSPPWDPTQRRYRRPLSPDYNTPDFVNERKQIGAAVSDALKWEDGLSRIVAEMTLPHFTPDPLCGYYCGCDIHDGYHIDCCVDGEPQWDIRGNCRGCGLNILDHN